MNKTHPKEAEIIEAIKNGERYEAIGKKFGLSRQRVSQIAIKNGIRKNSYQSRKVPD